jgi:hypothetical protein
MDDVQDVQVSREAGCRKRPAHETEKQAAVLCDWHRINHPALLATNTARLGAGYPSTVLL